MSIEIVSDAALFVLDDRGVFFSASKRELALLNTSATLVWCLIEQQLAAEDIVDAYRSAFAIARPEAELHVAAILQHWYGAGHVSRSTLQAPEVPMTTALAQILTNAALRSEFRTAPEAVTEALRVAAADAAAFAAIDPDQLDTLAREIAGHRDARSAPAEAAVASAPRERRPASPEAGPHRTYRLLSANVAIHVETPSMAASIHDALAHLESAGGPAGVTLEICRDAGKWSVYVDGGLWLRCRTARHVVPAVKQWFREQAIQRSAFAIRLHAAAVGFGDACALLPAAAGSGKTTLTAALIHDGAAYLSDEVALLEDGGLSIRPVPLALTLKEGSLAPLHDRYPGIGGLPVHQREDFLEVRYLLPPLASMADPDRRWPVKWIVFPRYDDREVTRLVPIERPEALQRLLREATVAYDRLDRDALERLVADMRGVGCYELPMSSLDAAVGLLRGLAAIGATG